MLGDGQVHPATEDCPNSILGAEAADAQAVKADQAVDEEIDIFGSKHDSRADRGRRFIVAAPPVVPTIELQSEVRIEIVGQGTAKTSGNIGNLKRTPGARITKSSGYTSERMKALIPYKQIPFRILI